MITQNKHTNPIDEASRKALLSNRLYIKYTPELYEKCKQELSYKIPSKIPGQKPQIISSLRILGERTLLIPIGRQDLIPENYNIVDNRTKVPVNFPDFKFTLREDQQTIYNQVEDNCLINANPSWGKTFTGIAIATKLKQKTIVIVHTLALKQQWEGEVRKTLGIEPGVITSGEFNIEPPIVIANIQTLRNRLQEVKKEFGLVIVDEVHHTPASTFETTLNMFAARYKIGLSATLERKDWKHVIIPDYFGKKVYIAPKNNQKDPSITIIDSGIEFNSNHMIPWATRVNELTHKPSYLKLITGIAEKAAEQGHKVLVVSDRTEFLEKCHAIHKDISVIVTGTVKDREERHKLILHDPTIRILYGAISIYKEGISLNCLSALVAAAPINNDPLLKQLIGRIERIEKDKLDPVVFDIKLKGATGKKQALARARYYTEMGYKIKVITMTKN